MRDATVVLCKSCRTCFKFYCMFYFTCDRSFSQLGLIAGFSCCCRRAPSETLCVSVATSAYYAGGDARLRRLLSFFSGQKFDDFRHVLILGSIVSRPAAEGQYLSSVDCILTSKPLGLIRPSVRFTSQLHGDRFAGGFVPSEFAHRFAILDGSRRFFSRELYACQCKCP